MTTRRLGHRPHAVTLRVGPRVVQRWTNYRIECDMLQPAHSFSLGLGARAENLAEVFDMCATDELVQVRLDETAVLTGLIDERDFDSARDGDALLVTGRDFGGRMVDESAPLLSFASGGLKHSAEILARPWFNEIRFSNATNRVSLRGSNARIAAVTAEPVIPAELRRKKKKVHPGETRWSALADIIKGAGLLAWSSGDGKALIIGQPNYAQAAQYSFFHPKAGSDREREGNVKSVRLVDSTATRYSEIQLFGSGEGTIDDYGAKTTAFLARARNGPNADGTGVDFHRRKVLFIDNNRIDGNQLAQDDVNNEMAERDSTGRTLAVTVRGHGQLTAGGFANLYTYDTIANFESEVIGVKGRFLVTKVTYQHARQQGEETVLELVPEGTQLKL